MLPALDVIAASIRTSRTEFGRLFLQAQIDVVPNANHRVLFATVGTSGVDVEAYAAALERARIGGWLEPLVLLLVAENLENGELAHALASARLDRSALEAMTAVGRGFGHPQLLCRGYNSGMQWTAKIMIDGVFHGTGVLVSPHLVLTAWHVVRSLFQPTNGANRPRYEPLQNASARLHVEFGDFLRHLGERHVPVPNDRLRIAVHPEWCVVHSPCHEEELGPIPSLPGNLRDLEGYWDYAILRLAKTPGRERSWARLDERAVVPTVNGEVIVFQYPMGEPLQLDHGPIVKPQAIEVDAVPRLRFLHGVNSIKGTSGGPCFDKTFTLVGLHQGIWSEESEDRPAVNRGVPIVRVLEHIEAAIERLPVPDQADTLIWHVSGGDYAHPVIGCDDFQRLIWRAALGDSPRIIEIVGAPGSGKTFRLSVLSALLPAAGHLKVDLSAHSISKLRAPEVADAICRAAGATTPILSPPEDYDATTTTWIRDVVVPQVITALDGARDKRLVWILIGDLSSTEIEGEHASELLHALYEQTRTLTWLRFVLDGMRGDIPNSVKSFTVRHTTADPTREDIETYLRRAVVQDDIPPDEDLMRMSAGAAERMYKNIRLVDTTKAMEGLAELAIGLIQDYQHKAASGICR